MCVHAAVNLKFDRLTAFFRMGIYARPQSSDFRQCRRNEGLSAETGIDAHHEDQVDQIHNRIDRIDRCRRVERQTRREPVSLNLLQDPMHMGSRFRVYGQNVRSGSCEFIDQRLNRTDHEMHIEGFFRMRL